MNGSDSFVLCKHGKVFMWNSLHSNEDKRSKAETFSKRILKEDLVVQSYKNRFYWQNGLYFLLHFGTDNE